MLKLDRLKKFANSIDIRYIDQAMRKNIWKFLGVFILMDALLIVLTPKSALQGTISTNIRFEGFSYIYGTIVFLCGFLAILHKNRFTRQMSVFFFYSIHTLLLFMFQTAPHIVILISDLLDPLSEPAQIIGLAPFLKYLALCCVVFTFYEPTRNEDGNSL